MMFPAYISCMASDAVYSVVGFSGSRPLMYALGTPSARGVSTLLIFLDIVDHLSSFRLLLESLKSVLITRPEQAMV